MSKLLRHFSDGQIYFITMVTYRRRSILITHHHLFWESLMKYMHEMVFRLIAHVELPDHTHMIIDPCKCNLSSIIQKVKLSFSKKVSYALHRDCGRIWQSRFWDHMIRDQDDMNRHIDYIHYNPVKHDYADSPCDWRFSSFREYQEEGYYAPDWGTAGVPVLDGKYGE
ncbi:MAG: transposase [candidate division Zixibacteria bacterium]|nr:transposase [candidate division Zixibacteria bacterium]MBU1470549.1 transposase [candidate division Zixibacteria bacterium]